MPCPRIAVTFLGLALLSGIQTYAAERPKDEAASAASANTETAAREQLREGITLTDELGMFRLTGDRATFYYRDGKQQIGALENLALERVARMVSETPDELSWSVSGVITEYRGNNYLLITRAITKRPRKPLPSERAATP